MFILTEMKDIIRIEPDRFKFKMEKEVIHQLNSKYANKVVYGVGLCIILFDVTLVGDPYIIAGTGAAHTRVHFRFIVFRPFIGEVLVGKIRSSSSDGLRVSLGFFDDIKIPASSLQNPSRFDGREQLWVWEYKNEDEEVHDMFMDTDEEIRFCVTDETFVDTVPNSDQPPSMVGGAIPDKKQIPYTITGTIADYGLGLTSWWS
ncbi:DNA-directed RNA polymerase III subunit RPC8-like [Dysidea avara]|uniref:DNA-directed RNA polymerase III subunit RPC8-like n=1 Tax=Dysidea avara TaxID=196820 RepID=UPI00331D4256